MKVWPRHKNTQNCRAGFTLIEMMVVVALFAIFAVLAYPSLTPLIPRFRLNRAVAEFTSEVQNARMMAIAEATEYRVCLGDLDGDPDNPAANSTRGSYTIEKGNAMSGSNTWSAYKSVFFIHSGDNYHNGVSLVFWTPIGGPGVGNENCMILSPKGWLDNPASDFDGGFIYIHFRNKVASPLEDIRTVRISRGCSTQLFAGALTGDDS